MITIIDYGIGNLRSIEKAFEVVGADIVRSDRPEDIRRGDKIVLPGVGAFGACIDEVRRRNLEEAILEAIQEGKPFLGVCVGMQLLFEIGEERGHHQGLGILPGRVVHFDAIAKRTRGSGPVRNGRKPNRSGPEGTGRQAKYGDAGKQAEPSDTGKQNDLKVPHIGWNTIEPLRDHGLLSGLTPEAYVYFVHSFVAVPCQPSDVLARCHYGISFPAMVHRENVCGIQFHPEKSRRNGLRILKNFADST